MAYLSTPKQMEEFFEHSHIWKDIKHELGLWLEDMRNELEDPSMVQTDKILHRLGGNAETLRRVLDLPDSLVYNIGRELEGRE